MKITAYWGVSNLDLPFFDWDKHLKSPLSKSKVIAEYYWGSEEYLGTFNYLKDGKIDWANSKLTSGKISIDREVSLKVENFALDGKEYIKFLAKNDLEGFRTYVFRNDDQLIGSSDTDAFNGMGGNDTIDGRNGNDELWGGSGNDKVTGGNGSDLLQGDDGIDILTGIDLGDKTLGRSSVDKLTGGTQNDTFVLGNSSGVFYSDGSTKSAGRSDYAWITDFTKGDKIQLKGKSTDYQIKSETFTIDKKQHSGFGLYLDDGSKKGSWDSTDELIGFIQTTNKLALSNSSLGASQGFFNYV